MTLRAACYRLFAGLVAAVVLSFAAELPRPLGTLGAIGFVVAVLYAIACTWRCTLLAGR